MNINVFCDMDQVLVNLEDNLKIISKKLKVDRYDNLVWEEVNKLGPDFWIDLPWIKDGKRLWYFLQRFKNLYILSALPVRPIEQLKENVFKGKIGWIDKHIPKSKYILCNHLEKQKYCKRGDILIDDDKQNIELWIKSGGYGILHKNLETTVTKLKERTTWKK